MSDLTGAGIADIDELGEMKASPQDDYTPPPAPTNVLVAANVGANMVVWDPPVSYRNFGFAEVWRGDNELMSGAVYVGETAGAVYLDQLTNRNDLAATTFKTYYYKVRFVSKAGVAGDWNAPLGSAATAELIDNAFIGSLHASKINAGTIAADRLDTNVITSKALYTDAGVMKTGVIGSAHIQNAAIQAAHIGDAQVTNAKIGNEIKSTGYDTGAGWRITKDGEIVTRSNAKTADPNSYDYTQMNSGNVVGYSWIPQAGHQQQRSLTRIETGTCDNGATIVIPGYWTSPPYVIISPKDMATYDAAGNNALSSQRLVLNAAVSRLSQDQNSADYYRYQMTGTAVLALASSGGYGVIANGEWYGSNSSNGPAASPNYAVAANAGFRVGVKVKGWYLHDYNNDSSPDEADLGTRTFRINLLLNGVVVASVDATTSLAGVYTTPSQQPYTPEYALSGVAGAGGGYFSVRVDLLSNNYRTPEYNNQAWIAQNFGAAQLGFFVSTKFEATGGTFSALATGTLNWIAVGR